MLLFSNAICHITERRKRRRGEKTGGKDKEEKSRGSRRFDHPVDPRLESGCDQVCSWRKHEGEGDVQGWTYGDPWAALRSSRPAGSERSLEGDRRGKGGGSVNEGREAAAT